MLRFMVVVFGAIGLLIIALLTAMMIGRQQPVSDQLALLHLTDCAPPCWIGITPHVTTMDEAKILVEKTYHDAASFQYDIDGVTAYLKSADDPYHPVSVVISAMDYKNTAPVAAITFHFDSVEDHDLTLPELFSLIDEPSRIIYATVSAQKSYYLSMDYKPDKPLGIELVIDSTKGRLEWSSHPRWLRFTGSLDLGQLEPWHGFAVFVTDKYGRLR
jgi:hypothetical protein